MLSRESDLASSHHPTSSQSLQIISLIFFKKINHFKKNWNNFKTKAIIENFTPGLTSCKYYKNKYFFFVKTSKTLY